MSMSIQQTNPHQPLIIAVPELDSYHPHSGIGRLFHGLKAQWQNQVQLVPSSFRRSKLPILRDMPWSTRADVIPDLVFLPKMTGATALKNTGGVTSVVVVHDIGVIDSLKDREHSNMLTHFLISRSFWALQHVSYTITDSEFTRDRLLHYLPMLRERVRVILPGIDKIFINYNNNRSEARQIVQDRLSSQLGNPIILYVGTEIPRKNILLLLRTFKEIKYHYPNAQLIKAGSSGQKHYRFETVQIATALGLNVGTDIVIIDPIDDTTLVAAYGAANVFVSPSLYEGFGLPAVESMAIGTPVVTTNCGAFPEIVSSHGWSVEPQVELFTQAIHEALALPEHHPRLLEGREYAAKFTQLHMASQYLEFFHEIQATRRHDTYTTGIKL